MNDSAANDALALAMTIALLGFAAAIVVALAIGGHRMLSEIEQGGVELNRVMESTRDPAKPRHDYAREAGQ